MYDRFEWEACPHISTHIIVFSLYSTVHSNVINRKFNHSMTFGTTKLLHHPKMVATVFWHKIQTRENSENIIYFWNWSFNVCIKIGMPHIVHACMCIASNVYFIIGIKWITNILWNAECIYFSLLNFPFYSLLSRAHRIEIALNCVNNFARLQIFSFHSNQIQ